MTKMKWLFHGIILLFLETIQRSNARAPVMFRASRCYDGEGTANVQLNCPRDFKIRVQTAFTGISRTNACSYIAWDCVIQEGGLQRCNGKNRCVVNVSNSLNKDGILSCGAEGRTTYFQIEYDCTAGDGRVAMIEEDMRPQSKVQIPGPDLIALDDPAIHYDVTTQVVKEGIANNQGSSPNFVAMEEDQVTLVAIVCGTSLALLLVIAVVAFVAYHRIKASFDQVRPYGSPSSSLNPMLHSTLSRRERELPRHLRNSNRRLPQPIDCYDDRSLHGEYSRTRAHHHNYDLSSSMYSEHV